MVVGTTRPPVAGALTPAHSLLPSQSNRRDVARGPWGSILVIALSLLLFASEGWTQDRLVRKTVPAAWQAENVQWIRDQNGDKIDDLISSNDFFQDIIVNYKHCPTASDIARLQTFGAVQDLSRYISTVFLAQVITDSIPSLVSDPEIAFVEKQLDFEMHLSASVRNIKVREGFYSPQTVEDFDPTLDGSGITICIMDTGVNTTHPTFASTVLKGSYIAIPPRSFSDPPDDNGHGTAVASIALGQGSPPTFDFRGVAPAANLVDVKIAGANGKADPCDVCNGLETVYDNRFAWSVDVINMSGGGSYDATTDGLDSFSQLVDLAPSMGIVFVTSVGNVGPNNTGLPSPQGATRAISVAWYDDNESADRSDDAMWSGSSRGPREDDGDCDCLDELKPEVAAPGVNIRAARYDNTGYSDFQGSSMASPHVAGLAALILQQRPGINVGSVREIIISSAEAMGTPSNTMCDPVWNKAWGWGKVDGYEAVATGLQTDLSFQHHPADPSWRSEDITTDSPRQVGVQTTVHVDVENRGTNNSGPFRVNLGVYVYSASTPTFYDIGTSVESGLSPGGKRTVDFGWVPQAESHQCLKAEIEYGPDEDYSNNKARKNVTVAQSPVFFSIQNTLSESPILIQFDATLTDPFGAGWTYEIDPTLVVMAPDDCPQMIRAELFPPANPPPGSYAILDVAAVAPDSGYAELGGVTVIDSAETPVAVKPGPLIPLAIVEPNPSAGVTTFSFLLAQDARVQVGVYDAAGRRVRSLLDGTIVSAGLMQKVEWDGTEDSRKPVASGVYFFRLETGSKIITRKCVIVR